jgi:DNA (cytosine-5)-methyltransferase 1
MRRIAKGIFKFVVNSPDPFIVKINHQGEAFRGQSIHSPFQTITAKNGWGLVAPTLIQYHGEQTLREVRGQRMDKPLMVVDASPRYALVSSFLTKFYGTNIGSDMRQPMPTITSGGQHIGEVRAFLMKYYGNGEGQSLNDPMHTITSKDHFGLVMVRGETYQIADIGLRMLEPRELFRTQGFSDSYIIDFDYNGKRYSKKDQVARCGNSVSPVVPKALIEANLPELCEEERTVRRYAEG